MNVTWLVNLSLAFDGSHFLAGDLQAPRLWSSELDWTVDASGVGCLDLQSGSSFLDLLRDAGVARLELLAVPSEQTILAEHGWRNPCELAVVAPCLELAWRLVTTTRSISPGAVRDRRHVLEQVPWPSEPQWSPSEAGERLRELLQPWVDDPYEGEWFRYVVGVLDGDVMCRGAHANVEPYRADEFQQRLFCATMELAAGKLTGMGGLNDIIPIDTSDLVQVVTQSLAATTRPTESPERLP